jgi:hypothetical protein
MSSFVYSSAYSSQLTLASAEATLSGPLGGTLPETGVVMGVYYKVYCGVDSSIRGQAVPVSFTLIDSAFQGVTWEDTIIAPTSSPAWVEFGGPLPANNVNFNALRTIELDGTNKLVTRTGQNCPLTINWREPLANYTDPEIIAGETPIKAVHMRELRENINIIRVGYGLAACSFAEIVPGYTSLGGWLDHINEMRAAIDETGVSHEDWILLEDNCPRADVMEQLRRVVAAL